MEPIIGHADLRRELAALAASPEPPHALLFAGPESTGRTALARYLAMRLTCETLHPLAAAGASLFGDALPPATNAPGEPCGACRACRLISEGVHPDVITVGPGDTLCRPREGESHPAHPESADIRICQVRGITDLVARYPFEARVRVLIIDPADRLALYAAPALLKTLEEPPGHTVFCLLTAAPERLLETVLSRCRRLDVRPVARAEIEAGLLARGVEPRLAAAAGVAARGRPGRALAYVAEPDLMGARERLLERCAQVAASGRAARFDYARSLADRWRGDVAAIRFELECWESFWEERLRRAASGPRDAIAGPLEALRAIAALREHLLANVQQRPAFDLMLLSFPRVTLEGRPEEELPANA
jgi:DNA polymerase III delta prime subunit